jgi:hypothetical protein
VSQQPVYRRPRSHTYSCRCPKCQAAAARSSGSLGATLLFAGAIAAVGALPAWPYFIWHGHDAQGHGKYDAATWVACGIWWAFLAAAATWITVALIRGGAAKRRAAGPVHGTWPSVNPHGRR